MIASQIITDVFARYEACGHRQYGEEVTELQHALQCAFLARRAGESAQIVAACLLHDFGHLLHDFGEDVAARGLDAQHEELGARALSLHFVPEVIEPIRLHVRAKRYLCWRQPQYFSSLSVASQHSLQLQGGAMSLDEVLAFTQQPHSEAAVRVRRYDDAGKAKCATTPPLESYGDILTACLRR